MANLRLRTSRRYSKLPSRRIANVALYSAAAIGSFIALQTANGATFTYTGATAGDLGTSLGNYNGSATAFPSSTAGDTILFNGSTAGALTLNYSNTALAGTSVSTAGIALNLAAGQTSAVSIDSGTNTGSLRLNNAAVTIASGAGAFTLGDGANIFNINLGGASSTTQTFTNNSTNTATINSDVVFGTGGGGTHTTLFNGTGAWVLNNTITNGSGSIIVIDNASALTLNATNNTYGGGTTVGSLSILNVSGTQGLGTGLVTILGNPGANGGLRLTGNITLNNAIALAARDNTSVGIDNVSGTNTISGAFTPGVGGTFYTIQSDAGLLSLSNTAPFLLSTAGSVKTLGLQGAGSGFFAAPITQAAGFVGSVTKAGAGTWSLGGASTYTGSTIITGGALTLSGTASINGTSGITVNGTNARFQQNSSAASTPAITLTQGTVSGTGTAGAVTVGTGTGATVANGSNSSSTLTLSSLTYSGTGIASLTIQGGSNTTAAALAVTGALSTSGTASSVTVNVVPSIAYINGDTYNLISYGTFPTGSFSDFVLGTIAGLSSRQSATLGQSANDITLTVNGDSPVWTGLDNGSFQVGSTGPNHNFKLITQGTPTDYIEGDNVLFDDTALGTTAISVSAANVSPSATTFNNLNKAYTLSGPFGIAGTGGLAVTGGGNVTINNTNFYTGATTIAAGTLTLNGTIGSGGGTAIGNASRFVESSTGVIAGTSSFATTAGISILSGINTYTGATSISSGATLQLGDGLAGDDGTIPNTSGVANSGSLVFNRAGANSAAYSISGPGTVRMSGTGTQVLNFGNTYTGGTIVTGGTLTQGVSGAFGSGSSTLTVNGGVVNVNGIALTVGSLAGTGGTIVNDGAVGITLTAGSLSTAASIYAGAIADNNNGGTGTISFTKTGASALTLSGASTFSGPVSIIAGGTLSVSSINSVVGGVASSNLGTPTTAAGGVISITGSGGSGALIYTGPGETTDRVIAISGGTAGAVNAYLDQSGTGLLRFSSNFTVSPNIVHTLTLQGSTAGNGEIDGIIPNGSAVNVTSLTKAGSDTWTLTAADTYSGATAINAGTLAVDSTINAAAALVASNSITVAGGASIHLISVVGSGTTTMLSDAATLTLSNPSGPAIYLDLNGQTEAIAAFVIGTTAQPAGLYSATSAPAGSEADEAFFSGNGSLAVGSVPEPASIGMLTLAGGMMLARRRRRLI